ncbi:MAG: hypothetical protein M3T56_12760 [Chloroflexota bacterium]|nr:hypothetical protein [Chloroflexota bacterium]
MQQIGVARVDRDELRRYIAEKYSEVATIQSSAFTFTPDVPLPRCWGTRLAP